MPGIFQGRAGLHDPDSLNTLFPYVAFEAGTLLLLLQFHRLWYKRELGCLTTTTKADG